MTRPGGVSRHIDGDATRIVCRRKPPKVWFCQQAMRVRANVDRTTIQGLLDSSAAHDSFLSAYRWCLRRVTAHVSRLIPPPTRPACPQAAFPNRGCGKLRRAVSGRRLDDAPTPSLQARPAAPIALCRPSGAGWRQARVQVSARAPLLPTRLSRA
jgi:hypothetical protein